MEKTLGKDYIHWFLALKRAEIKELAEWNVNTKRRHMTKVF